MFAFCHAKFSSIFKSIVTVSCTKRFYSYLFIFFDRANGSRPECQESIIMAICIMGNFEQTV